MNKVYDYVTERIIKELDAGTIPWRRPWSGITEGGKAVNWVTQKPYRGINALLLQDGEYCTFKQIQAAGGHVKKGEHAHMVVFFKMMTPKGEREADPDGEEKQFPLLRYYNVFELSQTEGLTRKSAPADTGGAKVDPIAEAERLISLYPDPPSIRTDGASAFYSPAADVVTVPPLKTFFNREEYYSTLFHELAHSTGHQKRLAREFGNRFGSEPYAREELVAEITAAMLCGVAKIENVTIPNSAAYIESWRRALSQDHKLIITAAGKAQKAADYITGTKAA